MRPGDVVNIRRGRYVGPAAIVASAQRKAGIRLTVITEDAEALIVAAADVVGAPVSIGRVKVPKVMQPKSREYRRDVARRLRKAELSTSRRAGRGERQGPHPVEFDPLLAERMKAAAQAERLERELADAASRIVGHNRSLGREFERVVDVLVGRGYIERDPGGERWSLTQRGVMLTRIFHECDLLVVEALAHGHFDGVGAAELAGLLSTFVYEHRSPEPPAPPWFPSAEARKRWRRLSARSEDLAAEERALGLGVHRPPDPGFFAAAHGWVAGHSLDTVVGDDEFTGGDFVRTMKQLVDLARQIADVAPDPTTRATAAEVATLAYRGVVADASVGVR
jgi:ATP-dependent RNA helicase HelY